MASIAIWCRQKRPSVSGTASPTPTDASGCINPLLVGPFGFGSRCVRFPASRSPSANVGEGGEVSRAAQHRTIRVNPPKEDPVGTHRYVPSQSSDHWGSEIKVQDKLDHAADVRHHYKHAPKTATGTGVRERLRPMVDPTNAGPGAYQPERTEVRLRPFTPTSEIERFLGGDPTTLDRQTLRPPTALLLPGHLDCDLPATYNRPSSSMSIGRSSEASTRRPLSVLSSPGVPADLQARFYHRAENEACADVWKLPFTTKQKLREGPPNAFSLTSESAAARDSFFTQRMTKSQLSGHCSKLELQLAATRPLTYITPMAQVAPTHNRLIQVTSARRRRHHTSAASASSRAKSAAPDSLSVGRV